MGRPTPATDPDDYVDRLDGWQRDLVVSLRRAVKSVQGLEEGLKWGHIVYTHDGPALLIRAENERVLFGFWRGRHMVDIDDRLKPSGAYDMATIELHEGDTVTPKVAKALAQEAARLNARDGDPRKLPPFKT